MRPTRLMAAAAFLVFAAGCGSAPEEGQAEPEVPSDMEVMEDYEASPDEPSGPVVVGLDEVHDYGDGVTIRMVDLRREVEEDGFNSVTGEEGALPYVAWRFEVANGSEGPVTLGPSMSSCFVGDPLVEVEEPVLGEAVNPPDVVAPGQTGSWDADCWMGEDESALQYTVEFSDAEFPPVTFAGEVP